MAFGITPPPGTRLPNQLPGGIAPPSSSPLPNSSGFLPVPNAPGPGTPASGYGRAAQGPGAQPPPAAPAPAPSPAATPPPAQSGAINIPGQAPTGGSRPPSQVNVPPPPSPDASTTTNQPPQYGEAGINSLYDTMAKSANDMWQQQQGMLQGQMAGFGRQADSLNARMGGSIAGGYAGLAGSGLHQGMEAYNKASIAHQDEMMNLGKDRFGALQHEHERQQGRDWAKEDIANNQDFQTRQNIFNATGSMPGQGQDLSGGVSAINPAAAAWYSGADGGGGLDWSRAANDTDRKAAQDAYKDWQATGNPEDEKKFTDLLGMSTYGDRGSGGAANLQQEAQDQYDQIMNGGGDEYTKQARWSTWKKKHHFS